VNKDHRGGGVETTPKARSKGGKAGGERTADGAILGERSGGLGGGHELGSPKGNNQKLK